MAKRELDQSTIEIVNRAKELGELNKRPYTLYLFQATQEYLKKSSGNVPDNQQSSFRESTGGFYVENPWWPEDGWPSDY